MTASLATCPLCAKQLAIPAGTSSDDRAECPECDATFLLSNAFQTSLPTARILQAAEVSPAPEVPPLEPAAMQETSSEEKSSEVASVASLASWESRLKNAIERDATELADQPSTEKAPPTEQPQSPNPEFDFHIDPPLAEQSLETEPQPVREFDQAELLATESIQPPTKEKEMEDASVASEPPTLEVEATEIAGADLAEAAELTIGLSTLHERPSRRFSPLKVAAVLIGIGLMGTFLGLYALLWIKGPSGDLINLAKVLPPAMLPTTATVPEMEGPIESAPPTDEQELPAAEEKPIEQSLPTEKETEEEIEEEAEEEINEEAEPTEPPGNEPSDNEVVHDPAVQLAAVEQPTSAALNALPDLFGELLAAARAAEPGLVEGDLSTNEAVSRKGQAYMAVCQLAQHFDAIHTPELDDQSQAEIASAKQLFASLASNPSALGDLAAIASRWWGYELRPNQGIFFAGQIQNIQSLGDQTLCYVALDEPLTSTVIPVLLDQPSGREGDRILVVGSIVSKPRSSLPGFTVDAPQVVVAAYSEVLQP